MSVEFEKITPYYLLDIEKVEYRYNAFNNAIGNHRKDYIAYSIKANYNSQIILKLNELNAWFEVCSKKELEYLLSLGVTSKRIIVNGNIPYEEIVKYANDCLIILDSEQQIKKWIEMGYSQEVGLRLNIDKYLKDDRFRNTTSRFGINIEFLKNIFTKEIKSKIIAIHCHLAGNTRETSIYGDVIEWIHKEVKEMEFENLRFIDIGGGYKIGFDSRTFSDYVRIVEAKSSRLFPNVSVIYEPGNSLVSSSMDYYTRVISEKKLNGRNIKIVDGSVLHLPHTKLENRKCILRCKGEKVCENQEIYGITCKESDLIYVNRNDKELALGDIVVISNMGAYSINEVPDFIVNRPNLYMDHGVFLDRYYFKYICTYSEIFDGNKRKKYSTLKSANDVYEHGMYAFIEKNGNVLYIGVAYGRSLITRIKQHFSEKDTGSIRHKFRKNIEYINRLQESYVCVCQMKSVKKEILCAEAMLIGMYSPEMCFENVTVGSD